MFQAEMGGACFVKNSAVVSRKIADETLIVPIRGGVGDLDSIFSLNPLGSELWSLMENGVSTSTMADWVVERYEVTRAQALADIEQFVADLAGAGLVGAVQGAVTSEQAAAKRN